MFRGWLTRAVTAPDAARAAQVTSLQQRGKRGNLCARPKKKRANKPKHLPLTEPKYKLHSLLCRRPNCSCKLGTLSLEAWLLIRLFLSQQVDAQTCVHQKPNSCARSLSVSRPAAARSAALSPCDLESSPRMRPAIWLGFGLS